MQLPPYRQTSSRILVPSYAGGIRCKTCVLHNRLGDHQGPSSWAAMWWIVVFLLCVWYLCGGRALGKQVWAFVSPALTTESDPPAILLHHFLSLATAQFSRKTEKRQLSRKTLAAAGPVLWCHGQRHSVISETAFCSVGCFRSLGSCSGRTPPLRLSSKVLPVL